MWKLFTECLACGVALPQGASSLYCQEHDQLARQAMAKIAWGSAVLPRLIFLLLFVGILIATSL